MNLIMSKTINMNDENPFIKKLNLKIIIIISKYLYNRYQYPYSISRNTLIHTVANVPKRNLGLKVRVGFLLLVLET